ncbi:Uncharacterized protein HZ326_20975 [Fusarium oxysporum f. sp. albedinis]|nr:Uncharacterized protein HZ326_20975 [Fusarium oxysporum f. sp. albedinis]
MIPSRIQLPTHSTFARFSQVMLSLSHDSVRRADENHHWRGEPVIRVGGASIKVSKSSASSKIGPVTAISLNNSSSSLCCLPEEEDTSRGTRKDSGIGAALYSSSQICWAAAIAGACQDSCQFRSMYFLRFEGSRRSAAAYTGVWSDKV